ncbi:MAG: SoxR reducing system RseC family protein [bacterium]|nr:SoxR reducing system RseC family protein [bacterium]
MERGRVQSVEGEIAWVQMQGSDACHSCGAKTICRTDGEGQRNLAVYNGLGALPGQWVEVAERGHITLKLAGMQFGLPLLGLLAGIGLAALWMPPLGLPPELVQGLCGILTMLASGGITYAWAQRVARSGPLFEVLNLA